jgi:hypothetical protein
MRHYFIAGLLLGVVAVPGAGSIAQEVGAVKTFGDDGRLFSSGKDDYYLLSSKVEDAKDYGWTDYSGQVRIVRHYPGGGYEIIFEDYSTRCGDAGNSSFVAWLKSENAKPAMVDVNPLSGRPKDSEKYSYNLYWAVCSGKFQKF